MRKLLLILLAILMLCSCDVQEEPVLEEDCGGIQPEIISEEPAPETEE